MDELKISNSQRSHEWISTSFNNQNSPSAFMSFGSEESVNLIPVEKQHYATSSVAYSSGYAASSSAVLLELSTSKPTTSPSAQAQEIYWGMSVPTSTAVGTYNGVNTFAAQAD